MGSRLLAAAALSSLAALRALAADSVPSPPGADWEGYNRSLDGQRYSPLDQIQRSNAASLIEVCRTPVAAGGSLQAGPAPDGGWRVVATLVIATEQEHAA